MDQAQSWSDYHYGASAAQTEAEGIQSTDFSPAGTGFNDSSNSLPANAVPSGPLNFDFDLNNLDFPDFDDHNIAINANPADHKLSTVNPANIMLGNTQCAGYGFNGTDSLPPNPSNRLIHKEPGQMLLTPPGDLQEDPRLASFNPGYSNPNFAPHKDAVRPYLQRMKAGPAAASFIAPAHQSYSTTSSEMSPPAGYVLPNSHTPFPQNGQSFCPSGNITCSNSTQREVMNLKAQIEALEKEKKGLSKKAENWENGFMKVHEMVQELKTANTTLKSTITTLQNNHTALEARHAAESAKLVGACLLAQKAVKENADLRQQQSPPRQQMPLPQPEIQQQQTTVPYYQDQQQQTPVIPLMPNLQRYIPQEAGFQQYTPVHETSIQQQIPYSQPMQAPVAPIQQQMPASPPQFQPQEIVDLTSPMPKPSVLRVRKEVPAWVTYSGVQGDQIRAALHGRKGPIVPGHQSCQLDAEEKQAEIKKFCGKKTRESIREGEKEQKRDKPQKRKAEAGPEGQPKKKKTAKQRKEELRKAEEGQKMRDDAAQEDGVGVPVQETQEIPDDWAADFERQMMEGMGVGEEEEEVFSELEIVDGNADEEVSDQSEISDEQANEFEALLMA